MAVAELCFAVLCYSFLHVHCPVAQWQQAKLARKDLWQQQSVLAAAEAAAAAAARIKSGAAAAVAADCVLVRRKVTEVRLCHGVEGDVSL